MYHEKCDTTKEIIISSYFLVWFMTKLHEEARYKPNCFIEI